MQESFRRISLCRIDDTIQAYATVNNYHILRTRKIKFGLSKIVMRETVEKLGRN